MSRINEETGLEYLGEGCYSHDDWTEYCKLGDLENYPLDAHIEEELALREIEEQAEIELDAEIEVEVHNHKLRDHIGEYHDFD